MTSSATIPVFDGHNDTLLDLYIPDRSGERSFFTRSDRGHIDFVRAKEGGFGGGFFAVFIPRDRSVTSPIPDGPPADGGIDLRLPDPLTLPYAQRVAMGMSALLFRLEAESQGRFKVVRTAGELEKCLANGVMAAILHFEGAEPLDTNLDALEVFYQAGLRSIGPVWSRANDFATGVPFAFPHSPDVGPGLTDAGKRLVRECNRLGIMIDLSHINEKGFWDVAGLSDKPLVATHSNVYNFCQVTRNLTDKQLDAIKESDGMVGLNFAVSFLREDGRNDENTPIETMVRHIDYLVERLGIERVGFGSDFDGARIPKEIGDVAGLPKLIDALRASGYDEPSLRKLAHENWVRILKATWGE